MVHHPFDVLEHIAAAHMQHITVALLGTALRVGPRLQGFYPVLYGGTLVFTGCVTAYITPALLGGPKVLMLETLLYQKVNMGGDLPAASVIAVLLLLTTVAVNQLLRRIGRARASRHAAPAAAPATGAPA